MIEPISAQVALIPTLPQVDFGKDADLPMAHLQLGARAYSGCEELGCKTIKDVVEGMESRRLSASALGKKTIEEVTSAVRTLCEVTTQSGLVWECFWAKRELADGRIALTSASLQRTVTDVRRLGLGALHLKKACSGLKTVGITTVSGLLDAAHAGIGKLQNFGPAARAEVVQALPALSKAVLADGVVDWCRYARERGFALIPEVSSDTLTGETVLEYLPAICAAIVPNQLDDRGWQIFQRRFLVEEGNRLTLEELGSVYNLTRERVRQIESMAIEAIRKPVLEDDYFGLEFRLRPELRKIFTDARQHFHSLGLPAWPESRWIAELAQLWSVSAARIERYLRLLVEIFGYRRVRAERAPLEALIFDDATLKAESKRVAALVEAVHAVLEANGAGLDSFELAVALKKAGQKFAGLEEVPSLVQLCPTVERIGERYRLRFEHVRGRGDQAFRILLDAGAPLHYSDLLREINRRLPAAKRIEGKENLVNHMTADRRMRPIGRSGEWALVEWGLETRSLVDVIADVLSEAGEAMPREEIAAKVLEKRAGAEASIGMLLDFHADRFRKVGPRMYGLSAWGDPEGDASWWASDDVAKFIEEFLGPRRGQRVEFREMREAFSAVSGLSARSAQGVLAFHPAVEADRSDPKRPVKLRAKWQSYRRPTTARSDRPLQADRIAEAALSILAAHPTGEKQLIEIVRELEANLGFHRASIYAAISQSDEIETIAVDGSALKICRARGRVRTSFPQLIGFANDEWRAECERGVAKLTIHEVDIGLFLLGRQFDQAMRQLLESAAKHSTIPVTKDHLKTLANRITWAVDHKVFHDAATLNLLRVERNARGHEPAAVGERAAVLKFAPYLAGLYIDYLLMVEEKIKAFEGGLKA